jgi:hypothetical protein
MADKEDGAQDISTTEVERRRAEAMRQLEETGKLLNWVDELSQVPLTSDRMRQIFAILSVKGDRFIRAVLAMRAVLLKHIVLYDDLLKRQRWPQPTVATLIASLDKRLHECQ